MKVIPYTPLQKFGEASPQLLEISSRSVGRLKGIQEYLQRKHNFYKTYNFDKLYADMQPVVEGKVSQIQTETLQKLEQSQTPLDTLKEVMAQVEKDVGVKYKQWLSLVWEDAVKLLHPST